MTMELLSHDYGPSLTAVLVTRHVAEDLLHGLLAETQLQETLQALGEKAVGVVHQV